MEGFLPLEWAVFWTLVAIPFVAYGTYSMKRMFTADPDKKLSVALSGAFLILLSSLKIPSVGGSSSHPTGTGMSVILSGPYVTVVLCAIVLLFQGTFMAHGGFTTLGANIFSMGIAGPFAAYALFRVMTKAKVDSRVTVFSTVFVANLVTYMVTSMQLALAVPFTDIGSFFSSFYTFLTIFAITQVPIATLEGVLMIFFFGYLADIKPKMVDMLVRRKESPRRDMLAPPRFSGRKVRIACFAIVLAAILAFTYYAVFFMGGAFTGTDDMGSGAIEVLNPGYFPWIGNSIVLGETEISILFVMQTAIGVAIIAAVLGFILLRREHGSCNEFTTVDTVAYGSPMLSWSPLLKLAMVMTMLVLNIAVRSVWMSVFTGAIGLCLLLYGSSFRIPSLMKRLFAYGEVFIIIGSLVFSIATPGTPVLSLHILGLTVGFTDAGISLAVLTFMRATASMLLMFSFAVSTPLPHFSRALKRLRLPDVLVEMMVLVYRYLFLLIEASERMHLAAECRFGYSTLRKSVTTTSHLIVGIFMQSLETAERGQRMLQCRNYRGEFLSVSDFSDGRETAGAAVCILLTAVSLAVFIMMKVNLW